MRGHGCSTRRQLFAAELLAVLLFAMAAHAQVTIGDNLKMNLNGILGTGYAGEWDNQSGPTTSSHGIFLQGEGNLTGSYYNPQFLNFNVRPYYNRNQENSAYASVLNQSGIDAAVNLFGGSHFPGTIGYSWSRNDGSQYGLFQSPGLTANGTTQDFNVSWSALFPKWPTLTATYSANSNSETILGETGNTDSKVNILTLTSNYNFAGFQFLGGFTHQKFNVNYPAFLVGPDQQSDSTNTGYFLSVTHTLPMEGSLTAGYSRQNYDSETNGIANNGTADTAYVTAGINPAQNLSFGGGVRYYDNLIAALQGSVIPPGSVPITNFTAQSNGVVVNGYGSYNFGHGLVLVGYGNWYRQHFEDQEYTSAQFGGTLTYSYARPLLGMLYFSFGLINTAGNSYQGAVAAVGNVGLKKIIAGWDINADFSYAQNVQNSLAWFTTSSYNYGASVRRRMGEEMYWTASARSVRTGITQFAGYNTHTETFITTLVRRKLGVSGNYSQTNGASILTTSGELVPNPLPPVAIPGEVFYGGASYGGTVSYVPIKRMVMNVSWFRLNSNTASNLDPSQFIYSSNSSDRIYGSMTYRFRKLQLLATYWKTNQQISSSGLGWVNQNNYTFTISRWFNVF